MTLQQRLNTNRELLGIPDSEQSRLAQLSPAQIAAILVSTIALLDAVDLLNRHSLDVELAAVKQLADAVEQAMIQAFQLDA